MHANLTLQAYLYEQSAYTHLSSNEPQQAVTQCRKAQGILEALSRAKASKEVKNLKSATLRIERLLSRSLSAQKTCQPPAIYSLPSPHDKRSTLNKQIKTLSQENAVLLTRPLRSEVVKLTSQLKAMTSERAALALHLTTTEELYHYSKMKCEELEESLKESTETLTTQHSYMAEERTSAHLIITTQRNRAETRERKLNQLERSVAEMKQELQQMSAIIQESSEQYRALSKSHNALEIEQEQLRSVLYGDYDVQHLKRQSFELQQELRKVYASLNSNASQETQANYLKLRETLNTTTQKLKESQLISQRLTTLLKDAKYALQIRDSSEFTQSEFTSLGKSLDNHLIQQGDRRNSRALILSNIKRLQQQDEHMLSSLRLTNSQKLSLHQSQGAIAPSVALLTTKSEDLKIYESLGQAAYLNGRLLAAIEFFEINLTQAPDHVPSLLKLGVTLLRQNNQTNHKKAVHLFKKAITASGAHSLPYAYQMIGYSYYEQDLLKEAKTSFLECIRLSTNHAIAHNFLGMILGREKKFIQSEKHFKKASQLDPTLSEPEYNLALVLASQGQIKSAKTAYDSALKKGATSDPILEAQF